VPPLEPEGPAILSQPEDQVRSAYASDVKKAFTQTPYAIPTKYLYDREGSLLFEQYTASSPQYYPLVEQTLITDHADELRPSLNVQQLIELGAGSCPRLTQLLSLNLIPPQTQYRPVDLSAQPMLANLTAIAARHPQLKTTACIGDFESWPANLYADTTASTTLLWFGNTAANSTPQQLNETLTRIANSFKAPLTLILGIDLSGDRPNVQARFPDEHGFFARFRWNALTRLNNTFNANFQPANFTLHLSYNHHLRQAESSFAPRTPHTVELKALPLSVPFSMHDRLIVGITVDYSEHTLNNLLSPAGWTINNVFKSSLSGYALVHLTHATPRPQ
jgi:L-histidine Nalpha-methyltransferase